MIKGSGCANPVQPDPNLSLIHYPRGASSARVHLPWRGMKNARPSLFSCPANLLFGLMAFRDDLERRAQESVCGPELIFQVTDVGKMAEFGIVDVEDERRVIDPHLSAVIDLELPTGMRRCGMLILRFPQDAV